MLIPNSPRIEVPERTVDLARKAKNGLRPLLPLLSDYSFSYSKGKVRPSPDDRQVRERRWSTLFELNSARRREDVGAREAWRPKLPF